MSDLSPVKHFSVKKYFRSYNRTLKDGTKSTNDTKSIDYNNDCISDLVIVDDKGNTVYSMGKKENNFTQKKINDSQIYISLAKLTDLDQIKNYYEDFKDKVNDPEQLKEKAREHYKAIRNAKKAFEEVTA